MQMNRSILFGLLAALALVVPSLAQAPSATTDAGPTVRERPWSDEAVAAFGALPVQESGRVKPFSTWVGFRLFAMNHKRSVRIPEGSGMPDAGEKIDPVRWALDVAFYPEAAREYECFLVQDDDLLDRIGLAVDGKKKRDRYSYLELEPGRARLSELATAARNVDAKARDRIDVYALNLEAALFHYDVIEGFARAAVIRVGANPPESVAKHFTGRNGRGEVPLPEALDALYVGLRELNDVTEGDPRFQAGIADYGRVVESFQVAGSDLFARWMPAFLPPAAESEEWRNSAEVLAAAVKSQEPLPAELVPALEALGAAYAARGDQGAVEQHLGTLSEEARTFAEAQGVQGDLELERSYYRADYFYRALYLFIAAFLFAAIGWILPQLGVLSKLTWILTLGGLGLVVTGVAVRCILLDRPPVATLYETILFITAGAVAACLFAEKVTRYRIALAGATVLGMSGMFLAHKWEVKEAVSQGDTMGGLVAVLNSNFWLATHVTTVTFGYAAGLMAALFGHGYIVARLYHGSRNAGRPLPPGVAKGLRSFGGLVYGTIGFGLVLSVVGTILGGVWANDSWGRFWGWDPKENGALMIVLYQLVIVHARLGGYIKDFGISVLAVVGGGIVAFSWWHVNQLGVGLHSYGFTDGVVRNLLVYYLFVAVFTAAALALYPLLVKKRTAVGTA